MMTYDDTGRPLIDDLGRRPEIEQRDLVVFPARSNRRAGGKVRTDLPAYRQCFELTGGKWEGFVSTTKARG